MTDLHVTAKRRIGAPAEQVYRVIADFGAQHTQGISGVEVRYGTRRLDRR